MAKETSSARMARIAARILAGGKATQAEVKALAASVLTQREVKFVADPRFNPANTSFRKGVLAVVKDAKARGEI